MSNNPSGSSSKLIAQVHHLQHLLENLPPNLPLNPIKTSYHFGLDSEHVDDEGVWYAFNCNLERGDRYKSLFGMIKSTLKMLPDKDCTFLCDIWLERLISAAELQGAKVLPKRKHAAENMGECVEPTKRACTCNNDIIELSDTSHDSNSEDDSELVSDKWQTRTWSSDSDLHKRIMLAYHLTKENGWNNWMTKWGGVDQEEEHRKARDLKKLHQCQLATQRQQQCREPSKSINDVLKELPTNEGLEVDVVALSCSDHLGWKKERSGKQGGTKQECYKCTNSNWYHPLLWVHIAAAAKKYDWSPQGMSGLPINVVVACSIMLAVIHAQAPELLTKFKCSEKFVRSFFDSVLNWTPQNGTCTAAKLPANAEEKCEESFFCLVYIIKWHHVPPELIIGFNQIGCNILPSSGTTFVEQGTQQVDIIAKDENTPEGTFLPFQQVWGGASEWSLLSAKAHGMSDVRDYGFNFAFAKSDRQGSHFSMLKTMKEYTRAKCSAHMSSKNEYPYVILCFVPAGCTGIFQPANIGLNRVIKHQIKQHQTEVYEFMTGPFGRELVQKDWNLSATCLTSKAAQTALDEYLHTHPDLHDEIKERMGVVHGVKDLSQQDEVTDDADDDADVLLSAVIQDAFGLLNVEIPAEVDAIPHCVATMEKGPDDELVAAGESEKRNGWNRENGWNNWMTKWGGVDQEEEHRKARDLKKLHQCQLATQRQQQCREPSKSINDVLKELPTNEGLEVDVVALSCSDHLGWKKERSGKQGGTKQECYKCTNSNWYHPLLWVHIAAAAKKYDWSPQGMSGLPINVVVACSIMLAVIHAQAPELLTKFKCSEKFVRSFFDSLLNWTPQKGTCTAAKLPANAEEKCEESFFCLVYIIKWHHVPPELIIGFNQIGCNILPSSGTTFVEQGTQQVDIIAKDENTPEGTFLPFQQVWGGASEWSLLSAKAHGMSDVRDYGFNFAFAKSDRQGSHFSMLKTMKEWVAHIFEPYRRCIIETDPGLNDNQISIIYLNCYLVHTGKVFCSYVFKE
ncbi:hypothetical protein BS17DRAFT_873587 [Gyrodon lividus]|nr:hypothetical protein BS17DRAFT_873587 [Gyrodon lividus]